MSTTALITGISGQDGYYLAKLLLGKGYLVHGVVRRSSGEDSWRLQALKDEMPVEFERSLSLHFGDVTDASGMMRLVLETEPDEIYHLAAQSHVQVSFEKPGYTHQVNADGTVNLLEAARLLNSHRPVKFYNAATSELFGGMPNTAPQSESSPFHPRSPYGSAKAAAYHHTVNYREAFGLFACNGILFNHESPMRGENFVTRKVTLAAARIKEGLQQELALGNLSATRDWGFAGDFVEAMWQMLQQAVADDYVIATGESHTVEEFVDLAFATLGLKASEYVRIDPQFLRPTEVHDLRGDTSKAQSKLGWKPRTSFEKLVSMMVQSDWKRAKRERRLRDLEAADE